MAKALKVIKESEPVIPRNMGTPPTPEHKAIIDLGLLPNTQSNRVKLQKFYNSIKSVLADNYHQRRRLNDISKSDKMDLYMLFHADKVSRVTSKLQGTPLQYTNSVISNITAMLSNFTDCTKDGGSTNNNMNSLKASMKEMKHLFNEWGNWVPSEPAESDESYEQRMAAQVTTQKERAKVAAEAKIAKYIKDIAARKKVRDSKATEQNAGVRDRSRRAGRENEKDAEEGEEERAKASWERGGRSSRAGDDDEDEEEGDDPDAAGPSTGRRRKGKPQRQKHTPTSSQEGGGRGEDDPNAGWSNHDDAHNREQDEREERDEEGRDEEETESLDSDD